MAGERQLGAWGEDAYAPGVAAVHRRENENRLGVVELASDGLHLLVGEAGRLRNSGKRVSTVKVSGEYVGCVKIVRHEPEENAQATASRLPVIRHQSCRHSVAWH